MMGHDAVFLIESVGAKVGVVTKNGLCCIGSSFDFRTWSARGEDQDLTDNDRVPVIPCRIEVFHSIFLSASSCRTNCSIANSPSMTRTCNVSAFNSMVPKAAAVEKKPWNGRTFKRGPNQRVF